jgi:gliding motility-associated-like protein/uncharacterized repeat protein (TIGR01451 family)
MRAQNDLSIFRVSSDVFVTQGQVVSFTFVVTNDKGTDVDGVEVQIDLPPGLDYIQHTLSQNFNPATGRWTIGDIKFYQPQRVITIDMRVSGEGVLAANAEIFSMVGNDDDSTPNNGVLTEDDFVSACVSAPIRAECGQSVRLEAPSGHGNYQWFKDGTAIAGATDPVLNVGETGDYTFQVGALTTTCPLGTCCPARVSFDSISVNLSQLTLCTGGFDTVFVDMPDVDTVNFVQTYTWGSPDDPMLNFLSCTDCPEPSIVVGTTYLLNELRYTVGVVTRDLAGNVVCSANATLTIDVLQAPNLTFNAPVYACGNDECIQIEAISDTPLSSIHWDGPNLRTPDGLVMDYCARPVTDYTTKRFVVTAVGTDGCIRVDSLFIITMPNIDISVPVAQTICQNLPADLSVAIVPALPTDSVEIAWTEEPGNPNAGGNLLTTTSASITTDSLAPGDYGFRVSVTRIAPNGDRVCTYEEVQLVTVQSDCAQPKLGGFAWKDFNNDGLRQNFEAALGGVQVELVSAAGVPSGRFAVTDAAGFYEFDNLDIGNYRIQFQPVPSFAFGPQNVGADEFIDSDVDATGLSDVFAATFDEAIHIVGAGYIRDCQIALTNVQTTPGVCGVSEGSLSFDVTGTTGNLSYTWVPNVSTTSSATLIPAGNYEITIFDDFTQCTYTEVLTVPGTPSFLLSTSSTPAACPLGKGGSITVFTDGGAAPFDVEFIGTDSGTLLANSMPFTIQDIRGGEYTINVTDADGCVQSNVVEVTENELLLAIDTVNVISANCGGITNGSFDVIVTDFTNNYTLTVNGLTIAANSSAGVITVSNQSAGPKVIRVVDVNECAQELAFDLRDQSEPIDTNALTIVDPACFGEATGIISSPAGRTYEVRDIAGQFVGNLPLTNLVAGQYTLIDQSIPGCLTTAEVTLIDPADWTISAVVEASDCDSPMGSIRLTVSGATPPYDYAWSDGLPNQANQAPLLPGDYSVEITDANGCILERTYTVEDKCLQLCDTYFTADTLLIEEISTSYDWCFANFDNLQNDRNFTIDGQLTTPTICTRSGLVFYNLESLPGDGNDGPYLIEFWYGGDEIVFAQVVNSGEEFAQALDASDGRGRWRFNPEENVVRGGQPDRAYGEIEVTHIASGTKYYLTPEIFRNQISSTETFAVPGDYFIQTVDVVTGCADSIFLMLRHPDVCADNFQPISSSTQTPYCDEASFICIDVPFDLMSSLTLSLDGEPYTGSIEPCAEDNVVFYDVSALDLENTITLESWIVNGRFRNAVTASVDELAARLTVFDNEIWTYDPYLGVLRGGSVDNDYRALILEIQGQSFSLQPQTQLFDGTRIEVFPGTYRATLTDADNCENSFSISVGCSAQGPPVTDTISWTVGVGFSDTLCVNRDEIPGNITSVVNLCPDESGEFAVVSSLDSTCFVAQGMEIGEELLCIVICDDNFVCDTTYIRLDVVSPEDFLFPLANPDTDSLQMNGTALVNVLGNDRFRGQLTSFEIIEYPRFGNAFIEGDDVRYDADPEFCGYDQLVYEICNSFGCDTALVTLEVKCDEIIIFSGFSPNFDDVNETFNVLGIYQFPGNRMEVYNRLGNLVFEMDSYDNSWEGTYFDGSDLAEGTYFYVFEDGKGRTYTGYVYLRR